MGRAAIPRVFWPVVSKFAHSPNPVYVPTWLPSIPRSEYAGKLYPGFQTFKRQYGVGSSYLLGLYTSPHVFDHAHRLFDINGVAGDVYTVNTYTKPVWLGKSGWAYLDPDGNVGWTITFVRAVGHAKWPHAYLGQYTYTVIGVCGDKPTLKQVFACLKHVAASIRRYTPPRSGHEAAT